MITRKAIIIATTAAVGVGVGVLCALLIQERREASLHTGSLWTIGARTYVDEPFVERLRSRVRVDHEDDWTRFAFCKFALCLREESPEEVLPGQHGSLYLLRDLGKRNDSAALAFVHELQRLGELDDGGQWSSWDEAGEA